MFSNRKHELDQALDEVRRALDLLDRRAEKMETILMVREPSSAVAADAYEGLRKQVVGAMSARLAHLSQLAQFDLALRHGADAEVLAKMVDAWLEQASLDRVTDTDHPRGDELYAMVSDRGGALEVIEPAYVDRVTGRLVHPGKARRGESVRTGRVEVSADAWTDDPAEVPTAQRGDDR